VDRAHGARSSRISVPGALVEAKRGQVVAFYSFKGGTGRSMALVNVACLLADLTPGERVLVIDWDLEAPGLHRYLGKELFKAFGGNEQSLRGFPGLIDLMLELRGGLSLHSADHPQTSAEAVELVGRTPIAEYIVETDKPQLDLLKSGRLDADYAGKVANFDWQDLYARSPHLLRALSEHLADEYAWVVIDSRTGLTDTSGICTMLMPETLVVVFTPNVQSLEGVVDLVRDAGRYRASSDDLRPLAVYPLPSRIEASEPGLRKLWRFGNAKEGVPGYQPAFEGVFKEIYDLPACDLGAYFDDVQIQHVPKFAYGEGVAVLGEESADRFSLTRSFQRFTKRLVDQRLPWESFAATSPEELPQSDEATTVRTRIASGLDRQVSMARSELNRRILRNKQLELAVTTSLTVMMAVLVVLLATLDLVAARSWLIGLSALAASLAAVKSVVQPQARAQALSTQLDALLAAQMAFDRQPSSPEALASLRSELDNASLLFEQKSPLPRSTSGTSHRDGIFISYRRHDAGAYAGRLYDDLAAHFGDNKVFLDVEVPLGHDFRRAVADSVNQVGVMLVVIGPSWMHTADSNGRLRLEDPADLVRLEIATALASNARVIPVLVDDAMMPSAEGLPEELRPLTTRQALKLSSRRWQYDVDRLIATIDGFNAKT
jgi:cellulose biosynthesis protein BcsQ